MVNDVNLKLEDIVFFTFPYFNVISISFHASVYLYIEDFWSVQFCFFYLFRFSRHVEEKETQIHTHTY